MERILIVEDSSTLARMFKNRMEQEFCIPADVAHSFEEALVLLDAHGNEFIVALLDLMLPNVEIGSIVDPVVAKDIPVIVFTGVFDEEIQEQMWAKHVVDYVTKDGQDSLEQVVRCVRHLRQNPHMKVLVVDDSASVRSLVALLLKRRRYQVFSANNGVEALAVLQDHPDISLVITDCQMPEMDGFALTRRIRSTRSRQDLAVIGMSAHTNKHLSAHFIKSGANDFISKPFSPDEFYCRVVQNLDIIEYVHEIREAAFRDFLTGLRNRHYFWKFAPPLVERLRRAKTPPVLAMVDIDFFKKVNDTYGHDAGDAVLKHTGELLAAHFGEPSIVARFGGEEFCVLVAGMAEAAVVERFEAFRELLAEEPTRFSGQTLSVTASIGICPPGRDSLDAMINRADAALYSAKHLGRNRVVVSDTPDVTPQTPHKRS